MPGCGEFVTPDFQSAAPPPSTRGKHGESIFFEAPNILISDARIVTFAQTFPLRNVSTDVAKPKAGTPQRGV
jgi:hypothetical protein